MNERLASHSLTAFSANVSKTGWRSNVERPITLSSSLVAACCSRASRSSRVRASIVFSNSAWGSRTRSTGLLAFVVFEGRSVMRLRLFAPLPDKVTSSARSLAPLPVGPAKDGAYRRERAALVEFRGRVRGRLCRLHYRQVGGLFPLQDAT